MTGAMSTGVEEKGRGNSASERCLYSPTHIADRSENAHTTSRTSAKVGADPVDKRKSSSLYAYKNPGKVDVLKIAPVTENIWLRRLAQMNFDAMTFPNKERHTTRMVRSEANKDEPCALVEPALIKRA